MFLLYLPVVNPVAARSQAAESCLTSEEDHHNLPLHGTLNQRSTTGRDTGTNILNIQHVDIPPTGHSPALQSSSIISTPVIECTYTEAVETLCQKIQWASAELKQSTNVDTCIQLCNLIKSSADAVYSLKQSQA